MKKSGHWAWLGACAFLLGYEWWALATGGQTLSRAMWDATQAWPLLIFIVGMVVGSLATHFWWIWRPSESKKGGG